MITFNQIQLLKVTSFSLTVESFRSIPSLKSMTAKMNHSFNGIGNHSITIATKLCVKTYKSFRKAIPVSISNCSYGYDFKVTPT